MIEVPFKLQNGGTLVAMDSDLNDRESLSGREENVSAPAN